MLDRMRNDLFIVFPEGKCNYVDSEIGEFEKGAFVSAYNCNFYIVPTYIRVNKYKNLGYWGIQTDKIDITYGIPYKAVNISEKVGKNKISDYIKQCILNLKSIKVEAEVKILICVMYMVKIYKNYNKTVKRLFKR